MGEPVPPKPTLLEATAVLTLISGILHVVGFVGLLMWFLIVGLATFGLACFFMPLAFFPLVMGIFEIRYALDLLPHPVRRREPNKVLAVIQCCLVLVGNVLALSAGVVALVAYADEQVKRYFEAAGAARG